MCSASEITYLPLEPGQPRVGLGKPPCFIFYRKWPEDWAARWDTAASKPALLQPTHTQRLLPRCRFSPQRPPEPGEPARCSRPLAAAWPSSAAVRSASGRAPLPGCDVGLRPCQWARARGWSTSKAPSWLTPAPRQSSAGAGVDAGTELGRAACGAFTAGFEQGPQFTDLRPQSQIPPQIPRTDLENN